MTSIWCNFACGHYLFHEANRAELKKNCGLQGTDTGNVQGQKSKHIFKVKWRLHEYFWDLKIWDITQIFF